MRPYFVPLELTYDAFDASLTDTSDDAVLFWRPLSAFQWKPPAVIMDLVEYNCAEQFMMTLKARLFVDDGALSAMLATSGTREQKYLGHQVLHFDHDIW